MSAVRDLPPLNALRAFEATARLGSASRAAEELHVTHGAISRHLRALEEALGQPLFARQGRGLALTAAGEQLRDGARDAFEQLRDTWARVARGQADAPFVLGCPGSLLARWMIPRLERLRQDLPSLKLHLSAQEAPLDASLAGIDAALLLAEPPWPGDWRVHELAPERIGPVLSPRYPGASKLQQRSPQGLLSEALLHTASRPQAWPQWAALAGLQPAQLSYGQGFDHLYYLSKQRSRDWAWRSHRCSWWRTIWRAGGCWRRGGLSPRRRIGFLPCREGLRGRRRMRLPVGCVVR